LLCVSASATTYTVDCEGGADFETIQEAVDAAAGGDTVLVAPCVYREQVVVTGKAITIRGDGADVTELVWDADGSTLRYAAPPTGGNRVEGLTIAKDGSAEGAAAYWPYGLVRFDSCVTRGLVSAYHSLAVPSSRVDAFDCELESVRIRGGGRSRLVRCVAGEADFSGFFDAMTFGAYVDLETVDSTVGLLSLAFGGCESSGDTYGAIDLHGGMHSWPTFEGEQSWLGDFTATRECDFIVLSDCEFTSLTYDGEDAVGQSHFIVTGCTIEENVLFDCSESWDDALPVELKHCTVLGDLTYTGESCSWYGRKIKGNIVMGETFIGAGECMRVSHNDFVGGVTIVAPGDSVFANISAPPLFCNEAGGDYTLQECSPCVGAAHDGGDIGAYGVGCDCATSVEGFPEDASWGRIKSFYR